LDLTQFVPQFGNLAFTLVAFIVALSVIVAVHEYGHYIVGRWCGIKAEVFSLGFGPVLASRMDRHGTRWQIAAIPMGGFVKFLGDANAASVGGRAVDPARVRQTMLGAPIWARSLTVAAGPVFNFILAALIFGAVILTQGRASDPATIAALDPLPPGITNELRVGDQVISVGGLPVSVAEGWFDVQDEDSITTQTTTWTVLRDGEQIGVTGPGPMLPIIGSLTPNSAALDVGLALGDVILAVDGQPLDSFPPLVDIIKASDGRSILLQVWRDGQTLDFTVVPRRQDVPNADGGFETRWLVGIAPGSFVTLQTETPSLGQTINASVGQVWYIISSSLSGLAHVISGDISTCALSGPVGIAEASGAMASQGAVNFIWFIAVLSVAVGMLNLFPVPMLDGGHLVFHAWEALTGRPPAERALRVLMGAGLLIVLGLTIFGLLNDTLLCP
jgi:regulator of sigma E protease